MNRRALAIIAGAVILFLVGCTSDGGPASMGGVAAGVCYSLHRGDDMLIGDFLDVPAGSTIRLTDVGLVDAHGVEVVDVWASQNLSAAFGGSPYPPAGSATWDSRSDLPVELDAGTANLLVRVRRTGDDAGAAAMSATYESEGTNYQVTGDLRFTFLDLCTPGSAER